MKNIESVELPVIREHERRTNSNATVGSYGMDAHCPANELAALRASLEAGDCTRLFLLGEFAKHTKGGSGRLSDVDFNLLSDRSRERVLSFLQPPAGSPFSAVDLRSCVGLELVIVSVSVESGPLVIIDGNHRAIAQFLTYKTVEGVPAFVCLHEAIRKWPYVPSAARSI